MDLICEFCKKELKTMSALNKHKKSAKYCLKLQNENMILNVKHEIHTNFSPDVYLSKQKSEKKSETNKKSEIQYELKPQIQNTTVNKDENMEQHICEFCDKKFTNKYNLRNHKLCCKEIKQQKVEELNCNINNKNLEISQLQIDIINLKNIINKKNKMIEKLEFIKEKNEELISNQMIKITELEDRIERLDY